jgi:hypothetical protein
MFVLFLYFPEEDLLAWYKNIRTVLSRIKKKKSGDAGGRNKDWTDRVQTVHDRFSFLLEHIYEKAGKPIVSVSTIYIFLIVDYSTVD